MAADRFLLDQANRPTLRLYQWDEPCLSIGYAQRWTRTVPVPVVRRPSGGRAVLHHREWTYAVVLPEGARAGTLQQVYAQITGLWLVALHHLDSRIALNQQTSFAGGKVSCFDLRQQGELVKDGRKLLGSAQVRRGQRLLQHGTIAMGVDQALFEQIFPGAEPPSGLEPVTWEQLIGGFPVELSRLDWTPDECELIEEARKAVITSRSGPLCPPCT